MSRRLKITDLFNWHGPIDDLERSVTDLNTLQASYRSPYRRISYS